MEETSSILPGHPSHRPADPVTTPLRPGGSLATGPMPAVPGYALLKLLGRGGMGVVYQARDTRLNRDVALKMLTAGVFADTADVQRFRAEAESIAALQHPNIVQVYEVGEANNLPFFAMEYVDGGSLHDHLSGQPLPPRRAAEIVRLLAEALQHAHDRGIIHRDIKPGNVLLSKAPERTARADGGISLRQNLLGSAARTGSGPGSSAAPAVPVIIPKLTDFGLAKRLDATGSGVQTETGTALGTPNYMAPEQASGRREALGPLVDVYALGALLYEMLIGRPPFLGSDPIDILLLVRTAEPVSPRKLRPTLPRDLDTICLKCLQKQPSRRYASAAALAADLRRYLDGEPIQARPVGPIERAWKWAKRRPAIAAMAATIAGVALLGFAGVTWQWRAARWNAAEAILAREQAEVALYESRVAQAALLWERNAIPRATAVLQQSPQREGRLRNWEWRFLNSLAHNRLAEARVEGTGHLLSVGVDGWRVAIASKRFEGTHTPTTKWGGVVNGFHSRLATPQGKALMIERQAGFGLVVAGEAGRLITAALDGVVQVWDDDGRERFRIDDWGGIDTTTDREFAVARNLDVSRDGRWLARRRDDHAIELRDLVTNTVTARFVGHTARPNAIRFRADGRQIVSRGDDGTLRIWDLNSQKEYRRWHRPAGFGQFDLSPDGRWLAFIQGGEHGVQLREVDTERDLGELASPFVVREIAFGPDGRHLVARSEGEQLQVWRIPHGGSFTLSGHNRGASAIAFHPDGVTFASGGHDGEVRLWTLDDGESVRVFRGHATSIQGLGFSPDGRTLYSCELTGAVYAWDPTRDPVAVHAAHVESPEWCSDIRFSPDGREVRAVGTLGVGSYDVATGLTKFCRGLPMWHVVRYPRSDAALAPDGETVYGVPADDTHAVAAWQIADGRELRRFAGLHAPVLTMAVSPDHRWLAASAIRRPDYGETIIWSVEDGQPVHRLPHAAMTLTFDVRGRLAMAVVDPATPDSSRRLKPLGIQVHDPARRTLRPMPLDGEPSLCFGLAFSPDGQKLAATLMQRENNDLLIWDVDRAELACEPITSGDALVGVAFSPDGKRIAINGYSARVSIRNAESGGELLTLPQTRQRHSDYAFKAGLAFCPEGRRLAAFGPGGIYIWDTGPPGESGIERQIRARAESDAAAAYRAMSGVVRHVRNPYARRFYLDQVGDPRRLPRHLLYDYGLMKTACGDWTAARNAMREFSHGDGLRMWAHWELLAVLHRLGGGPDEYARFCRELPDRIPGIAEPHCLPDRIPGIAEPHCWRVGLDARIVGPGGATPADILRHLTRYEEAIGHDYQKDPGLQMHLALAEYRAGRIGPWTAALDESLRTSTQGHWTKGFLVMALIRRSEGNSREADRHLQQFHNWLAQLPDSCRREGVMPYPDTHYAMVHNWPVICALYQELTGRRITEATTEP